jgi:very-short-patch-repair endonuclease
VDGGGPGLRQGRSSESHLCSGAVAHAEARRRPDPRHPSAHQRPQQAQGNPDPPLDGPPTKTHNLRAQHPGHGSDATLEDLRRSVSPDLYRRARREAEFLRLPLGNAESDGTATELEARLLAVCRRHRIPKPEVNVPVGPYIVDFLWPDHRLVVEVDGWEGHGSKSAFEDDRARDARLTSLGYRVLRFTWRQLNDEPGEVAAILRQLLTA